MMDNYPDGAANDPNAPWNQKDPVMVECEDCGGGGKIPDNPEPSVCLTCEGTGEVETDGEYE